MGDESRIGAVLVTHANLGEVLAETAREIVGSADHIAAVSIGWHDDVAQAQVRIETAIAKVDQGRGVIILTDMFGGTPSNVALAFLEEGKVEVISGVNLAMVVKIADQGQETLQELAQAVKQQGIKQISIAGEVLTE